MVYYQELLSGSPLYPDFSSLLDSQVDYKSDQCEGCEYTAFAVCRTKKHQKVHGKRPYTCDLCPKRYKTESEKNKYIKKTSNKIVLNINIFNIL